MAREEGDSRISAPIILFIEFSVALVLALYLLHKYGNFRKQNPFVTVTTLLVWFLCFVSIFLLPVDVSSAFYQLCLDNVVDNVSGNTFNCSDFVCSHSVSSLPTNHCYTCYQPYSFICPLPLEILWYIIYWLLFVLSWIILPLGQSYVLASYFSVGKKIVRALVENAILYITLLLIFVALFVYLIVVKHLIAFNNLPWLLATASNTWGLLILALLLGYGLVEVPRTLFNASRRGYTLKHCYFKAAKLYMDMADADDKLKEVTDRVKKVSQSLKYNDPLRKYMDVIIGKFPEELQAEFSTGRDDYEDFQGNTEDMLTKSSLETLLKKAIKATRLSKASRIHWLALTDQALDLEDTDLNATSQEKCFKSSVRPPKDSWTNKFLPHLEWYWKLWFRPWVYFVLAILLAFLSLSIVWSEATFSIQQQNLSVFARLVYASHKFGNYISVEALSIAVVAYLSICAYFTVFRIRIFNLYYLAPNHSTDEYSLLFSALLFSRLALPICLNYLYMIRVVRLVSHDDDDEVPKTAFAFATGNTDLIPWLTSYFYIYYPALVILVCVATLFSVGSRLASLCGYQKFIGEDDFSADYIDEGRMLMKRERRIRERHLRDNGRTPRSQLPFDILKESRTSSLYAQRRAERTNKDEEHTPLSKFISKARSLASKTKSATAARYTVRGADDFDDAVELLPTSSSEDTGFSSHRTNSRLSSRNEPPKDIFDDI